MEVAYEFVRLCNIVGEYQGSEGDARYRQSARQTLLIESKGEGRERKEEGEKTTI